ncbi:MAG: hypothetical protein GTN77_02120 [Planctomycetales bacterium]|nr:hypothetical protein [Planctomycetales bacterium]NIN76592.1 hypothetical protein [Planctomycetales bacterium]NIO45600.1 hypothetical protein [Planctomycetales bacterium]NIP68189.1 hypothetical protein [Planctomycetales bacterium]
MSSSKTFSACLLALTCLPLAVGCNYGPPRLFSWTPWSVQRQELQRFDPYPDNDIGPVMEGVRPPDFQQQVSEPVRSRWLQYSSPGAAY